MTAERAIFVIENEKKCVQRNVQGCDRDCANCDLVLTDEEVLTAYDMAVEALKKPNI